MQGTRRNFPLNTSCGSREVITPQAHSYIHSGCLQTRVNYKAKTCNSHSWKNINARSTIRYLNHYLVPPGITLMFKNELRKYMKMKFLISLTTSFHVQLVSILEQHCKVIIKVMPPIARKKKTERYYFLFEYLLGPLTL